MKKYSFTLAEVLITLGIIGVVAAMTIPNLIANTNSTRYRAQFRKTLSSLNQAVRMSQAKYDFDFSAITRCQSMTDNPEDGILSMCSLFNIAFAGMTMSETAPGDYSPVGATKVPKLDSNYQVILDSNGLPVYEPSMSVSFSDPVYVTLADGALVVFSKSAHNCHLDVGQSLFTRTTVGNMNFTTSNVDTTCYGYIDVNGRSGPNKEVKCDENPIIISGIAIDTVNTTTSSGDTCVVSNDRKHLADIYPVAFYNGTVEPLTNAARYVARTSK